MKPISPFVVENTPKIEAFYDQLTSANDVSSPSNRQPIAWDQFPITMRMRFNYFLLNQFFFFFFFFCCYEKSDAGLTTEEAVTPDLHSLHTLINKNISKIVRSLYLYGHKVLSLSSTPLHPFILLMLTNRMRSPN
jgi:hypothetical protein